MITCYDGSYSDWPDWLAKPVGYVAEGTYTRPQTIPGNAELVPVKLTLILKFFTVIIVRVPTRLSDP